MTTSSPPHPGQIFHPPAGTSYSADGIFAIAVLCCCSKNEGPGGEVRHPSHLSPFFCAFFIPSRYQHVRIKTNINKQVKHWSSQMPLEKKKGVSSDQGDTVMLCAFRSPGSETLGLLFSCLPGSSYLVLMLSSASPGSPDDR